MGKKLYVGNLGYEVSSSDLEQLCSPHGTVESAEVISDRMTGRSKGFGFVEMASDSEAQAAITALNGRIFKAGQSPLMKPGRVKHVAEAVVVAVAAAAEAGADTAAAAAAEDAIGTRTPRI